QLKSRAMALREIIILPDKQLRLVSNPIEKVTAEVRKLADDMFETMYAAPGIGLAAIQVAQPLRLITMDLAKRDEDGESKPRPRVFINPEILSSSEETSIYEEGCLSIPEYYEEVERPAKVRVRLIFMGPPEFAVPTLLELVAHGHEIAAVYTRAAKPAGRGMKLQPTPVEVEARRLGIPVLTPTTLKTPEALEQFRAHNADAAVVVAYGMILPQAILGTPKLGCFNLHAS